MAASVLKISDRLSVSGIVPSAKYAGIQVVATGCPSVRRAVVGNILLRGWDIL
jgi:hypothetical protein